MDSSEVFFSRFKSTFYLFKKCLYFIKSVFFRKLVLHNIPKHHIVLFTALFHIKYNVLNYIRNLVLTFLYSSKSNSMFYLSTRKYYIFNTDTAVV